MRSEDLPLRDYGVIGNCRSAALLARDGSVDWLCWPRFDSDAVFCRLLDRERGGYFRAAPSLMGEVRRRYLENTNILVTHYRTAQAEFRATDFMPIAPRGPDAEGVHSHWVVRRLECLAGQGEVDVQFRPTFGFARSGTTVEIVRGGALAAQGELSLALVCAGELRQDAGGASGRFRMQSGETRWVVLAFGRGASSEAVTVAPKSLERALEDTEAYWRGWIRQGNFEDALGSGVVRSALTLKLLTYAPTGAIVAAPTTSLPERPGGVRNWDYRFTWLRDAALSLHALQRVGFHDEAMKFWKWIAERIDAGNALQLMYGVDGAETLTESELDHLSGWRDSRPVRVGNAAYSQRQGDIYGEVLDAIEYCQRAMPEMRTPHFLDLVRRLADEALEVWSEPDRGIWEMRGPPRHFLQSKLMCWVALDRAARIGEACAAPELAARWRRHAEEMRRELLARGYNAKRGAFTQAFDTEHLDATALLLPILGVLPANDPRMVSTVERVQDELTTDGLVRRYVNDDGLPSGEGAFLPCSFWLIDNLALQGRAAEARDLFEHITSFAGELGLFSEEVEVETGALVGNFPQAFTHLAHINAAQILSDASRGRRGSSPSHAPPTDIPDFEPENSRERMKEASRENRSHRYSPDEVGDAGEPP